MAIKYKLVQKSTNPRDPDAPKNWYAVPQSEAALEGKRELFDGLYLGSSDYDFHQYPVIHLDMSDLPFVHGVCNFTSQLNRLIAEQLSAYGIAINEESDPGSNLRNGMKALWQKTGEKIAILIDEYDNPLTSTLSVKEGKEIRECVSELYGYLKPCAEMIHFQEVSNGKYEFERQ